MSSIKRILNQWRMTSRSFYFGESVNPPLPHGLTPLFKCEFLKNTVSKSGWWGFKKCYGIVYFTRYCRYFLTCMLYGTYIFTNVKNKVRQTF